MGTGGGGADNQYVPGPVPGGYERQPQSPPPPPPPQQAQGLEGGNVQSSSRPELDYVLILNLALRIATLLLALISVAVIASAEYNFFFTDYYTGIIYTDDIKALHSRPYKFLVATAVIVMAYELVQVILLWVAKGQSKPVTATFWAILLTFAFDHVLGYLMLAAASSGATEADLFRHFGQGNQCSLVGQLCTQVESGVAMSYLAFATLAVSVLLSGFTFARHTITYRASSAASKRASSEASVGV